MTEISRTQFTVCLVAVVLVVLLGGRALRAAPEAGGAIPAASAGAFAPAGGGAGAPDGASGATGAGGVEVATEPERVLVHVAGAVRRPGVYELAGGARVRDALAKAGGGRSSADLDVLNLAAKVTDGQQVLVTRRGRRGAATGTATPAGGRTAAGTPTALGPAGGGPAGASAPVDVNRADATQLEALDGVGPAIAAKIVDWRTQNGPFKTVDDLAQVPGIGPKKLEAMRAQVVT